MTAKLTRAMYSLTEGTAPNKKRRAGPVTVVMSANSPVVARQVDNGEASLRSIQGIGVQISKIHCQTWAWVQDSSGEGQR